MNEYKVLRDKLINELSDKINNHDLVWLLMGHYLVYRDELEIL